MKHKLLPTMIGAVLAAGMGAAQADITVFGHLDTAIVNQDTDHGFRTLSGLPTGGSGWYTASASFSTGDDNQDDTNFKCTTCSIGFKGSEDLGNGLKAIFKLDFQFDAFNRNSSGSITDRDQWLGLAGNFGQVRFGSISTGYKSHGAMIDPLYRTAVQGRSFGLQSFLHSGAGEEGQGRADNTVRWDSPNWNGVKVTAHYTLDSSETNNGRSNAGNPKGVEDDNPYGIGAQYKNGGMLVFADYITNDSSDTDNTRGDIAAWKIGGKYTMNNFALMGQYEDIDAGYATYPDSGGQELTVWHLGGSYTMGNNMIYLGYGMTEAEDLIPGPGDMDDLDSEAFTIAGTHSLSKRTTIYAAYNTQSQDADADVNHSFTNPPTPKDVDKDIFAVGMKHKF